MSSPHAPHPRAEWLFGGPRRERLLDSIDSRLRAFHRVAPRNRVKGTFWEEMISRSLDSMRVSHNWDPDSHQRGRDIELTHRKRILAGLSAKSGTRRSVSKDNRGGLHISGFRLSEHKDDLPAMIATIKEFEPTAYIAAANPLSSTTRFPHLHIYSIFLFPGHLLDYGTADMWTMAPNGKDYLLETPCLRAEIKMGTTTQLWTTINLAALNLQPVREIVIPIGVRKQSMPKRPGTLEEARRSFKWGREALSLQQPLPFE